MNIMNMKKCILFTILLLAGEYLWACAESLMPSNQLDKVALSQLAPSSQNMLSIASLIAFVSEAQTVNASHIILAALIRLESSKEEIRRLNVIDIVDDTPTFNALGLVLKELGILTEVQRFLLSHLDFAENLLFELRSDGVLTLYLEEDISSIPTLMYDESAKALLDRAIVEKEDEIRYIRNLGDKTFFIPTFEEHFFIAAMKLDTPIQSFLSELLDKPPAKIIDDFSNRIEQARQTLLSISKRKRTYYSKETRDKAVQLAFERGTPEAAKELNINYHTLVHWVRQDNKENNRPIRSHQNYSQKERDVAVELALKIGNVEKAAKQLKIRYDTLADWFRQYSKENNQPIVLRRDVLEERQKAVQSALKIGIKKAAEELNIVYGTLVRWVRQYNEKNNRPIQSRRIYSSEEKKEAVELALEKGIKKAAEELNIVYGTLVRWIRKDDEENNRPIRSRQNYSSEEKKEAVELALEKGIKKATEELNISYENLRRWVHKDNSSTKL